jgi:hypothetical protein
MNVIHNLLLTPNAFIEKVHVTEGLQSCVLHVYGSVLSWVTNYPQTINKMAGTKNI